MPSKSPKQKKFMSAAAHSPEFAEKAGIPQGVAKDFHMADRGKYGHKGGKGKKGKSRDSSKKREMRLKDVPL